MTQKKNGLLSRPRWPETVCPDRGWPETTGLCSRAVSGRRAAETSAKTTDGRIFGGVSFYECFNWTAAAGDPRRKRVNKLSRRNAASMKTQTGLYVRTYETALSPETGAVNYRASRVLQTPKWNTAWRRNEKLNPISPRFGSFFFFF